MPFAQLVIGPPGSGKSTYCDGMHQFMTAIGRKCNVVNLDPANDHVSYPAALDVRDLVTLDEVMEAEELGPNGGVLYALEELEHNVEWLENELVKFGDDYILFDCPGQVELFTHHSSLRNVFFRLQKLGYRLVVVHLVDSHCLTLPTLYVSSLLLSLRSMLQLDLPHLNVLTKIDNLVSYPPLPMSLEYYTDARSLEYLIPYLEAEQNQETPPRSFDAIDVPIEDDDILEADRKEERSPSRFAALNHAILELVEDFGLVGFETLAVEDRQSMMQLLRVIDKAGGYAFGGTEGANESVWQVAVREAGSMGRMEVRDIEERWIDRREEFDEMERNAWEEEGKIMKEREANTHEPAPQSTNGPGSGDNGDPELDDFEEWKAQRHKDSGVKIVRTNDHMPEA